MASVSLAKVDGWGNLFFPLAGVLALSPSHGERGGRFFLVWQAPTVRPWSPAVAGRNSKRGTTASTPPLPAEDVDPRERVAHAANVITIQAVPTAAFTLIALTTGSVVSTFGCGA